MAKTRIDMPSWQHWIGPCLLIYHALPAESGETFDFHIVALWDAPTWNPWDVLCWAWGGTADGWPEYPLASPQQLELAHAIINDPAYLSDMCPYCNSRYAVPRHIRWNIHRGGIYPYQVPACAFDGSPTPHWNPDYWPPLPLY